jgi:hypothetical protein
MCLSLQIRTDPIASRSADDARADARLPSQMAALAGHDRCEIVRDKTPPA